MRRFNFCTGLLLILFTIFPLVTHGAELIQDKEEVMKAEVTAVSNQVEAFIPGTNTESARQTLEVKILDGIYSGETVTLNNDYFTQLEKSDVFYLKKLTQADGGKIMYSVVDPYRLNVVYSLVALFILLAVIFGGKQGVRGIVSLAGSLVLILYVMIPGILQGYSPIVISIGVASLIIVVGSYVTHGFNKTTSSAVLGMIMTVFITGILAHYAILWSKLTGFTNEESVYLNFNTNGNLNFVALLLGGMIIGLLGVLYDAAIGQAVAVEELHRVAPHLSRFFIFKRAIRIGREHIGALINTLAIAYVGVSLPVLLLFSNSHSPISQIINREDFSTEIIRTMIGSIGLVLAVPVTTLLAVYILIKTKKEGVNENEIAREKSDIEHLGHHH